jgi:hypothetical protein
MTRSCEVINSLLGRSNTQGSALFGYRNGFFISPHNSKEHIEKSDLNGKFVHYEIQLTFVDAYAKDSLFWMNFQLGNDVLQLTQLLEIVSD